MRKYLLVAFIALSPIASYACSHDMLFSAPHMHNHEALVDALNQSQGKQPKPFDLNALPAKPSKNQFQAKGFRKLPGYKMPNAKAKA
ncbi:MULTISPECIES: hypothetical protein [unclassified Agarivorans]|uniref:hypothetical protein n=1 Tax=unclassified Agarivorans TaxID=2636026 RepID=UPI0026E1A63A|nr:MULTISPECIES: hypothetical protein [unclassified Agarivorans]MDO6686129.1 hypothetical protein [Agarivorans sp. 3_MG-2023]MDO6716422.1 hypothetical protein [Agarivorans sp. 2_MG-2023]MDO6764660.1 hypothetical protein [Agarivorans sp. 1_MG-2023]